MYLTPLCTPTVEDEPVPLGVVVPYDIDRVIDDDIDFVALINSDDA